MQDLKDSRVKEELTLGQKFWYGLAGVIIGIVIFVSIGFILL